MSIQFNHWDLAFQDAALLHRIKDRIEEALRPVESAMNTYADPGLVSIVVKHLSLGTIAPRIAIAEIPFFSESRILVYVRVEYSGDANMSVTARLHASGNEPLPVTIAIESLRLRGMLLVEVREELPGSRAISARFINDPLESVLVSSSLDRQLPFVKGLLAAHITKKIRDFLNHELPDLAKQHIELPFLTPPEQPSSHCLNNLDRLEELSRSGQSGLAAIAHAHASTRSTNSRGAILTKTSMRRP